MSGGWTSTDINCSSKPGVRGLATLTLLFYPPGLRYLILRLASSIYNTTLGILLPVKL